MKGKRKFLAFLTGPVYFFQHISSLQVPGTISSLFPVGVIAALLIVPGCAVTESTSSEPAPSVVTENTGRTNTADTTVLPPNKFTVQVGAFQSTGSADRTADLAGDRYTRSIYTFFDETGGFYKVYIGIFNTKEEARRFRDRMAQQYPGDYRDAWVAELKR